MQDTNQPKTIYLWFGIITLIFVVIEVQGLAAKIPGDEQVYFYMGKLVSEGNIPYRDFFYAHPPVQIIIYAIVLKIFGGSLLSLKATSLLATVLTAFLLFKIGLTKFNKATAIIGVLLFLFSYEVLFTADYGIGINLATFFFMLSLYFLLVKESYLSAGIVMGIAGLTRLYTIIPIGIVLLLVLLKNRKLFISMLIGFLSTWLLGNILLLVLFGSNFLTPVYAYHFMKQRVPSALLESLGLVFSSNWLILISAATIFLVKNKKKVQMIGLISIAYIFFIMTLNKPFTFYFILIFPLLGLIGGYGLSTIYKKIKVPINIKRAIAILFFLFFLWLVIPNTIFLTRFNFLPFQPLGEMNDIIKGHAPTNTMLFGDDATVPLLAFISDRNIVNNMVDTNDQVFSSKVIDLENTLLNLAKEPVSLIVIRPKKGIGSFPMMRAYLQERCSLFKRLKDRIEGEFYVYKCL